MPSILSDPYARLKIPKAHRNVFQALAVDLCNKANVNYNAERKTDFNRFANLEFSSLQILIKRIILNYKPLGDKFQVSAVIRRKVNTKQLVSKFRGLDDNTTVLGLTTNNDIIYLTRIINRPALFGNPDSEITSYVTIKPKSLSNNGVWTINLITGKSKVSKPRDIPEMIESESYSQSWESHHLSIQNGKLICEEHGYNKCLAYNMIKTQKLKPGNYTFLADDDDIQLNAVPLKTGQITDDSLNYRNYKYKKYADVEDQVNFMRVLINERVYEERDKRDAYKLLNQITKTEHKMARGTLFTQLSDILKKYAESPYVVIADVDEILSEVLHNDPPPGMRQDDVDRIVERYMSVLSKLKADTDEILDAIVGQRWDDVIFLLCEEQGGLKKVNQRLQDLLKNSSVYMAVPSATFSRNLNQEIVPYYSAVTKNSGESILSFGYLERRLDTDVNKHKASLDNLMSFPKYGMIGTKDYPFSAENTLVNYGSILVEFKEVIKERSSLCVGDSIDKPISPPADFDKFDIYNFIGVLVDYPRTHYSTVLDHDRIHDFLNLLDNIMDPEALKYGLDINFLMHNLDEYFESYFEVQIKGELVFSERDIKAIYVNNAEDAANISQALQTNKSNIPLKYSQQIPEEYLNVVADFDVRQGNEHFSALN